MDVSLLFRVRYGLVVRIAGSHPAGPGSIPGNGIFLFFLFELQVCKVSDILANKEKISHLSSDFGHHIIN